MTLLMSATSTDTPSALPEPYMSSSVSFVSALSAATTFFALSEARRSTLTGVVIPFIIFTAIWGSTWIVIRDQLGTVPPQWSVAYRFFIAAAAMALAARIKGHSLRLGREASVSGELLGIAPFPGLDHLAKVVADRRQVLHDLGEVDLLRVERKRIEQVREHDRDDRGHERELERS